MDNELKNIIQKTNDMNKKETAAAIKKYKAVRDEQKLDKEALATEIANDDKKYTDADIDVILEGVYGDDGGKGSGVTISDDLKQHMSNSPKKERVWLNDAGEWCNHNHPSFPHEVTRDEILDAE